MSRYLVLLQHQITLIILASKCRQKLKNVDLAMLYFFGKIQINLCV